jgi:hypothetical protein
MLETAVALTFAHLLADFVLQTNTIVQGKHRAAVLLVHVLIVAAVSWAALGFAPVPGLLALIAGSHLVIDNVKRRWGGPGFAAFAADQAAHLAMIALGVALYPGAFSAGIWAAPATLAAVPWLGWLPEVLTLGAGLLAAVWAGDYAIRALMRGLSPPNTPAPEDDQSLPRGGRMIGRLERLMILMLVLMGDPGGIGFLITAKSILRFGDISGRDGTGDEGRRVSEYVIIGTLASFAWALATAYVTLAALEGRAP